MRTLLLSKQHENYFQKCALEHKFASGIIIAHNAEPDKCIAVHLARNSEEDGDFDDLTNSTPTPNAQSLASQWISATKMCPGSFDVMGIFVSTADKEVLDESPNDMKHAKKLFSEVHGFINKNNNMLGIQSTEKMADAEYIYLAYSAKDRNILCQNFTTSNGGKFTPMEHRIVEKPFEWISFECSYELDDVHPLYKAEDKIDIEEQFRKIVHVVRKELFNSEILIFSQLGPIDDTQQLQHYLKQTKKYSGIDEINNRVTILLPMKQQLHTAAANDLKVCDFFRTTCFGGVITSRIFCNPRNSVADVKRFVREDIFRSLAARAQIYCDGLTDTHITKESFYASEPPRRVYFSLANTECNAGNNVTAVQFSEYLFRGEASTVAIAQAKQVLDAAVDAETIAVDVECFNDDQQQLLNTADSLDGGKTQDDSLTQCCKLLNFEITRTMLLIGAAISIVLIAITAEYLFF